MAGCRYAYGPDFVVDATPRWEARSGSPCGFLWKVLGAALLLGLLLSWPLGWWTPSPSSRFGPSMDDAPILAARKCGDDVTYGAAPWTSGHSGPSVPRPVDSPVLRAQPGLAPVVSQLDDSLYRPSEVSQGYLQAFNPTSLKSLMPESWKAEAGASTCKAADDDAYSEFSRYSVSPSAVARSDKLKSTMRLSENTRNGLGRTLGYQSLLRNYVTPLVSPANVGRKAFTFNDSQVRQSYIAAVTGAYPDELGC